MRDTAQNSWEEVEEAATSMFHVWTDGSELLWVREAWGHLHAAGLVSGETMLEVTASRLRLVALARIYREFCGLAWDEDQQTLLDYLAEHLGIDPVALGLLASAAGTQQFLEAADESELRKAALEAVTDSQRAGIFECLRTAYGSDVNLYTRLWHTRSARAERDSEGDEFEVNGANSAALDYVMNGFQKD